MRTPRGPEISPGGRALARPGARRRLALALALAALAASAAVAAAQSGVRVTRDGRRALVSKDVGGQRWAITRNPDGTVTGNVFSAGGPPQFVWCEEQSATEADVELSCWGADRCERAPCPPERWSFIADVTLPASFFAPPGAAAPTPVPTPTPLASASPTPPTPTGGGALCGNGVIDPGEECDGADLDGNDCEDAYGGFNGCTGTLACTSDCRFDGSACRCDCLDDSDCTFPISSGLDDLIELDCTGFFCEPGDGECAADYECLLGGVCEAGFCRTSPEPTLEICTGLEAPDDPDFPRCTYCEDFDCSAL